MFVEHQTVYLPSLVIALALKMIDIGASGSIFTEPHFKLRIYLPVVYCYPVSLQ